MYFRSQGKTPLPMVIRIPFGGGIGAVEHHSESPEAQFAHTPGLKVVACSNPVDGYWMIQQAIAHPDPVIFLEPKRQYHADKAELDETATPDPLFSSRVVAQGSDVTVLAYGPTVKTALKAAEAARNEGRRSKSSTCARSRPLDMGQVSTPSAGPVARWSTHEAHVNLGMGAELAARITEECFYSLEAPVLRVGGFDTPYPPSRIEEDFLPDLDRVLDAVDRTLDLLRGPTHGRVQAARRGRGPHRGRDRDLEGQGGRHGRRSTRSWSRSRPPSRWSSCRRRTPASCRG